MVLKLSQNVVDPLRKQATNAIVEKLLAGFEHLRILDREMPGQVVCCFLYVASHDRCHKQAMEEELGLTPASSSRNTDILSRGRYGRQAEGLDLITKEVDPTNRRRQILTLTPRGKSLIQKMLSTIYD